MVLLPPASAYGSSRKQISSGRSFLPIVREVVSAGSKAVGSISSSILACPVAVHTYPVYLYTAIPSGALAGEVDGKNGKLPPYCTLRGCNRVISAPFFYPKKASGLREYRLLIEL